MRISIEGLSRAEVLAGLFNAARPQGLGFLHYDKKPMTAEAAQKLLEGGTSFDYIQGRVMKLNLDSDTDFDPRLYDRDNGEGAAQQVIDAIRSGKVVEVASGIHKGGVLAAADHVKRNIHSYGTPVAPYVDSAIRSVIEEDDTK